MLKFTSKTIKKKTVLISPFFSDLAAYFLSPVPKLQPKTPKRIKK
jgi:hypothetical protein